MARPHLAALALACLPALAGCASDGAPAELTGLWSVGPAACSAGVGVRFRERVIEAVYSDTEREALFEQPRYSLERRDDETRVRIAYELPRVAGGAHVAGAYGVLVIERGADGALKPASHNLIDRRTGSARLRLTNDPALAALALSPCGDNPWREELRGRRET